MLSPSYASVLPSLRAVPFHRSGAVASQRVLAKGRRNVHSSHRREQTGRSSNAHSSSSSSSRSSTASPSILNILLATTAIVVGTPYALDLYGSITGTSPSDSTACSIPGKLEPHTHHALPLASSRYYPDGGTASAHKWLQIALPAPASVPAGTGGSDAQELNDRLRIRSVYIKEPSLVIERAYTPLYDTLPGSRSAALHGASAEERQVLDLIVKRYPDGELGRMLHRAQPIPAVAQLEVRGPVDTWSYERDSSTGGLPERIVMVVGGTGVTPAFQLLTNLFGRAQSGARSGENTPSVHVLYATPDLSHSLLLPELHALAEAHSGKIKVSLFAERLASPSTLTRTDMAALGALTASPVRTSLARSLLPFLHNRGSILDPLLELTSSATSATIPVYPSRITPQHLQHVLTPTQPGSRTLVLVCGPDPMVDALAGPKPRNPQSQPQLSGILAQVGLLPEDVFKL